MPLLAASIAIGIVDNSAFFLFQIGLLSDAGIWWMSGALLLWIALLVAAVLLLGIRSLWFLVGLPLVLIPFWLAILVAGQI